jgi:hypothetical protein
MLAERFTLSQEKDSIARMIGEFCRELAVLGFIFVPLEWDRADERHSPLAWWIVMGACVFFMVAGITIERLRDG